MAINKVSGGTVLRLELQIGVNGNGDPILRSKNLSGIRDDAADQDLFDVAVTLAGLQKNALNRISRVETNYLTQA